MQLHFADCVLDCDRYELIRAGERIDVQPKVWAFLRLLAENAHRLLTKEEILERLWPEVTVSEASLQRLASLARDALGDEELLRTLRGVGYQLAAEVLGVRQPHVSMLVRNRAGVFSVERLMEFLTALGHDVEIRVRRTRKEHGKVSVVIAA